MQATMQVIQGDITTVSVDVIVNAANSSLLGGGGVDGAIHRAAGPALLEACRRVRQEQGDCPPGHAVITTAGNLPAKAVVHTVGPVWHGGDDHDVHLLEDAYRNSLMLAEANNYESIAFPAISTGVYGYPKAAAAEIAINTVEAFLADHPQIRRVVFVCFDDENAGLYRRLLTQRGTQTNAGG
ncbi:MAG: O-acetyl-ADP-ribose deacetylase [Metakosakonia sp.]|nr:O-acetyl-ADP-ribose deacetylase [Phytobacter sp.]MBV8874041.1 O-acetyl-ADP-ribose deacetylase [Phytobacter sp.]